MLKSSEGHRVVVALPDHVEVPHRDVDGFTLGNLAREIDKDAIAKFASVEEANQRDRCFEALAVILEHALTPEAAHGVFPNGSGEFVLIRAAGSGLAHSVNTAG